MSKCLVEIVAEMWNLWPRNGGKVFGEVGDKIGEKVEREICSASTVMYVLVNGIEEIIKLSPLKL